MEPWIAALGGALAAQKERQQELQKQKMEMLLKMLSAGYMPAQPQTGQAPLPLDQARQISGITMPSPARTQAGYIPVNTAGGQRMVPPGTKLPEMPTTTTAPEGGFRLTVGGQEYWKPKPKEKIGISFEDLMNYTKDNPNLEISGVSSKTGNVTLGRKRKPSTSGSKTPTVVDARAKALINLKREYGFSWDMIDESKKEGLISKETERIDKLLNTYKKTQSVPTETFMKRPDGKIVKVSPDNITEAEKAGYVRVQ